MLFNKLVIDLILYSSVTGHTQLFAYKPDIIQSQFTWYGMPIDLLLLMGSPVNRPNWALHMTLIIINEYKTNTSQRKSLILYH